MKAALFVTAGDPDPSVERTVLEIRSKIEVHGNFTPNTSHRWIDRDRTHHFSLSKLQRQTARLLDRKLDMAIFVFNGYVQPETESTPAMLYDQYPTDRTDGLSLRHLFYLANRSPAKSVVLLIDGIPITRKTNFSPTVIPPTEMLRTGVSVVSHGLFSKDSGHSASLLNALSMVLEGGIEDFLRSITLADILDVMINEEIPYHFIGNLVSMPLFRNDLTSKQLDGLQLLIRKKRVQTKGLEFKLTPFHEPVFDPEKEKYQKYLKKGDTIPDEQTIKRLRKDFARMQELFQMGILRPKTQPHMYAAALNSDTVELTELGKYLHKSYKHFNP